MVVLVDKPSTGDLATSRSVTRPATCETGPSRPPTHTDSLQTFPDVTPNGPTSYATAWLEAFQTAGHQLGTAAANGTLQRGLRALLTHIVIFHWNRLGLSASTQAILAQAAQQACLPQH